MQPLPLNKTPRSIQRPTALFAATLLSVAFLLGGCAAKKDHVDPPAPLKEFAASITTQDVWSHVLGSADRNAQLSLTPWVGRSASGSVLVATDARGQVVAFDSRTGEQRWRSELGFAVAGGVVAAATKWLSRAYAVKLPRWI